MLKDLWFIFKEDKLLVHEDSFDLFQVKDLLLIRSLSMGFFQEKHVHVGEVALSAEAPSGAIWADLKGLHGKISKELYQLAGKAVQLALWDRSHQFCSQCGGKVVSRVHERSKECVDCHFLAFPKVSPAIMALVQKEDEILLARSPHFPEGMYSVLAGFVDPGETLEECVKREVFEEVGLIVDEISYFGSQPWPFPHSLMIAFTCKWVSGEIKIDPLEISDARWFQKKDLPLIPTKISISRDLIDSVLKLEV